MSRFREICAVQQAIASTDREIEHTSVGRKEAQEAQNLNLSAHFVPLCGHFHQVNCRESRGFLGMSIPSEPEELLRAGEGIGVRTRRAGKVGERAGDGGRGLQI
jgi:hypothetical protein